MYDQGRGVVKDESKAAQWFAAAAAQGHANAQYNLGICDRARESPRSTFVLSALIADCNWKVWPMLKAGEWPKTSRRQCSGTRPQPRTAIPPLITTSVMPLWYFFWLA
jgi:hypothetical protein